MPGEKRFPRNLKDLLRIKNPMTPKQIALSKKWSHSMAWWGLAASVFTVYLTDWKLIVQYIPYYSGKFERASNKTK